MSLSATPSRRLTPLLRGFFYLLISVVLVLLLIGIGGFFWIAAQSPLTVLGTQGDRPAAAIFVPKQAPVMASLLVNPDRLRAFSLAAARPNARRQVRATFDRFEQNILGKTGLNYDRDIKPWLGDEITLAITAPDYDRDAENGQQPGYLLAIDSQDSDRSREFLQLFWQKRALSGIDLVFEQYAGVKIIYGSEVKSEDSREAKSQSKQDQTKQPLPEFKFLTPSLASAVVGDRFVLFANHPKVLRDAINNVQAAELSLDSTRSYQDALQDLPNRQIGLMFINLPQVASWTGQFDAIQSGLNLSGASLSGANSDADRLYESLIVALQLDRLGLVADTALLTSAGKMLAAAQPRSSEPVTALKFVPANSPLAAAGVDLQQLRSQLADGVTGYGKLAALAEQFQTDLQTRWSLERSDLFDWVQGEFALAMLTGEKRAQPEWIFVAEKTDAATAEVERLDTIAQQQGLSIGSLTLENQTVSAWTKLTAANTRSGNAKSGNVATSTEAIDLKAEVQGVHATVGNYEVFATSVEAMDKALQAAANPITTNAEFQQSIAPFAAKNDGYLYLDWQIVKRSVEQQPIVRLAELTLKPLFNSLRSISVTTYGSEAKARRGAVFLRLDG